MNNEDFHKINGSLLESLPYNTELIFPDDKSYRKEYHKDDLEWRELGDGWREGRRAASQYLAKTYETAQIWGGEHKNYHHKYITGDRFEKLADEADSVANRAKLMFEQATSADQLMAAKNTQEQATGMYLMLAYVRGYQEGN